MPPAAVSASETPDWSASGEAGQAVDEVICSMAPTVNVQLNDATGEPTLSDSVTENGNDPAAGGVPETVTLFPVVALSDNQGGPDRPHVYGAFPPEPPSEIVMSVFGATEPAGHDPATWSEAVTGKLHEKVLAGEFAASDTVTVNEPVPALGGVPDTVPFWKLSHGEPSKLNV